MSIPKLVSWKTTLAGLSTILGVFTHVVNSLQNGTPIDFTLVISGLASGLGLMFARDNNKTSEDVGAVPKSP